MRIKAQYIGLDEVIDQQVIKLIQNGIVNTSSIVINGSYLEKCLTEVKNHSKTRGLMLNLTQGQSVNNSSNGLWSIEELQQYGQIKELNVDLIKSEIRAQIYKYINIFEELPLHIDGLEEVHQIPEIAQLIACIMEQEFGVYEIHFQLRNILANTEMSQQLQHLNKLIKTYCAHNIKPVIFMEQDDLYVYKESLNKINIKLEYDHTCNLRYGITLTKLGVSDINSQQIPKIMPQKRLSQSSLKINQIIRKISSDNGETIKTNILIYSKINPATGNQTFALRLKKILDQKYTNGRKVFFRGIDQFNQNDQHSLDKEVKNLTKFIKDHNIGMCLGINVYRTSIVLSKVKQCIDFDLVSIIAGTDAYEFLDNESTAQQMKEACDNSSLIVSINEEMKKNFVKRLGIPEEKIPVVNQSIDLSLASTFSLRQILGLSESDKLILFPAGVRKVKNCKFLIEPMKQLLLKYPNHYLVHVGSILEQKYYNEYINEIERVKEQNPNLKNRFIFYGSLDYPSYLGALQQSDLILNCSFSEGQCNSILEAMGSKILSLISRIEGNISICEDNQTALMFEGEQEFISQYDKIFNQQINTQQIIENAFQKFEECYDFNIEAKGFSDLFTEIDQNNNQQ